MLAGSAHHQLGRGLLHTEGQVAWLSGDEVFRDPVSSMGVILTSPYTHQAVLNESSREKIMRRVGRFLSPEDAKS